MPSNEPREPVAPPCLPGEAHHWIIETAHGKTSPGRCDNCHEVFDFHNSIEDNFYNISKAHAGRDRREDSAEDGNHRDSWVI